MTRKTRDDFTKSTHIKQGILLVIICLITALLAAILPWVLNAINPTPDPTVLTPTFVSFLNVAIEVGLNFA